MNADVDVINPLFNSYNRVESGILFLLLMKDIVTSPILSRLPH